MYKYTILVPLWYARDDGTPWYPMPHVLEVVMSDIVDAVGGVTCESSYGVYGYWIKDEGLDTEMRIKDEQAIVSVVCSSDVWNSKVMPIMCWLKKHSNQQSLFVTTTMVEIINV